MSLRCSVLVSLALSVVIAACGDDKGVTNPDARPTADASPDASTPDASPDASTCTPVDDGNDCTDDVCEAGVPVHNPLPVGTTCATGQCDGTGTCVALATCTDNVQNGDETGIDCGGVCAPGSTCDDGDGCNVPGDCTSGVCTGNICQAPACGDGVAQAGEMCDDGNQTNGDGCDDGVGGTCRPTGCGNGTVTGTEECDDANAVDGDGCDSNCTTTACGNAVTTAGEECDDGNIADADGCSAVCAVEAGYTCTPTTPSVCSTTCGDGIPAGTEECDDTAPAEDGDGCSATCTVEPGYTCSGTPSTCTALCGDGVMTGAEQCDDGNMAALDGCSATCTIEATEIEPNEDGTPSTGGAGIAGNDFDSAGGIAVMNANNNGAIQLGAGFGTMLAAITPLGDEDVFAIHNDTALPQIVRFDIWNRVTGYGQPCPDADLVDTGLNIRNAAGTVLASNDDRSGGADRCSGLSFAMAPGATVYAHVVEFGDNLAIPGYGLTVLPTAIVCGDGVVVAAYEECDDGNTDDTDGCTNACLLGGVVNEVEPNDTTAQADANGAATADVTVRGSIGAVTDVDFYRIDVATFTVLRLETFAGVLNNCDTTTTTVRIMDAAGVEITNDNAGATNASGIAACGALTFPAPAGTYYVKVEETGVNATIAKYFLQIDFTTAAGAEAEAPGTMGTNDTSLTAEPNLTTATSDWVFGDHTLNADGDFYLVTIPAGQALRAELVEGDRPTETCEGNNIDSRLTLLNTDGTTVLVDDDDDGRGFCSAIDGTGNTPRDANARNTTGAPKVVYLQVRQSTFASGTDGQFVYRLSVTIR